jgi:microcin C transport system permease protein
MPGTTLMKNSLLDVIKLDYVLTAKAKGLTDKVVYMKHALRNALIPIVTGMSGILSIFLAGSFAAYQARVATAEAAFGSD